MVVAIGWEIAEQPLKRKYPGVFPNPSPDTAINASWDIAATTMGYAAADALDNHQRAKRRRRR
jgi:hypothetical protein